MTALHRNASALLETVKNITSVDGERSDLRRADFAGAEHHAPYDNGLDNCRRGSNRSDPLRGRDEVNCTQEAGQLALLSAAFEVTGYEGSRRGLRLLLNFEGHLSAFQFLFVGRAFG